MQVVVGPIKSAFGKQGCDTPHKSADMEVHLVSLSSTQEAWLLQHCQGLDDKRAPIGLTTHNVGRVELCPYALTRLLR